MRRELQRLGPVAQLRAGRLPRRLTQLAVGLVLYGATLAMIIRSTLGNAPWDVLHQGLAVHLPITIGQAVIAMSLVVLLLWIPLREMPGLGTIANSFVVGLVADAVLGVLPAPDVLWVRVLLLVGGVFGNALATALYIGSQFGPGPRDGLMTGLHRRTGVSIFAGPHGAGGHRRGDRLVPRRRGRHRHGALRDRDRAAGPADAAGVHRRAGWWMNATEK